MITFSYFILYFVLLGGKGNAFAVIYPSEKTICIQDFENENFEMLLEESSDLINGRNSESVKFASKIDVGDRDPSSSDWDHIYIYEANDDDKKKNTKNESAFESYFNRKTEVVKVVLYGVIGSTSFCQLHSLLSLRAKAGDVRYAVRHAYPNMIATSQVTSLFVFVLISLFFYLVLFSSFS